MNELNWFMIYPNGRTSKIIKLTSNETDQTGRQSPKVFSLCIKPPNHFTREVNIIFKIKFDALIIYIKKIDKVFQINPA